MSLAAPAVPAKPTQADYVPLKQVRSVAQALRHPETIERFKTAAPGWSNGERLQRLCYAAVMNNEALQAAPMWTLVRSCLQLGSLGLEPNSPLGHGYLIPFGRGNKAQVQTIVGYKGFILLAHNSGIANIRGDVVYEGDPFDYQYGTDQYLRHRIGGSRSGRKPVWAYGTFDREFEVRAYADVLAIRDASQGYRYALAARDDPKRRYIYDTTPWVAHEHPMAAKTMIRSALRFAALTPELAVAAQVDSRSEAGERTDFRHMNTGMDTAFVEGLPEDVEDLTGAVQGSSLGLGTATDADTSAGTKPAKETGNPTASESGIGGTGHQKDRTDPPPGEADGAPAGPFWAYMTDAAGDAEEMDGTFRVWTDAVQWATAFADRFGKAPEDHRQALLEQNADAIHDAREHWPSAALVLDAIAAPTDNKQPADPWVVGVIRHQSGKLDTTATVQSLIARFEFCKSEDDVASMLAANAGSIEELPASARKVIDRAAANRRGKLSKPVEPAAPADQASHADAQPDAATQTDGQPDGGIPGHGQVVYGPDEDKDLDRLSAMIAGIQAAQDMHQLMATTRAATHTTPLVRFDRDRPELADRYREALEEKKRELGAKP